MMKKNLFFAAVALVALVSCSSDEFVGDIGSPNGEAGSGNAAISFGFDVPQVTRAGGADAAEHLNYQFIVYGEKNEIGTGAGANVSTAAGASGRDGHLVFKNYVVNYTSNSAYTTTSNTKDWEYVAQTPYLANVTPVTGETTQTIKYWDYGASNYVFTAISANNADIAAGRVSIGKTTSGSTVFDKGYTITLAKTSGSPDVYPSLDKIYLSDRLVISNAESGSNREAVNKYGGNVTLTFRNLLSQVRAGVYETIPGYDIISMDFYVSDGSDADSDQDKLTGHAFGAICPNVKIGGGFEGTLNVTYYETGTAAENQPKVSVSGSSGSAADLILGTNMSSLNNTTPTRLGTTAADPTWDTAGGDYTNVLPQSVGNTTNLKLKCDYTLWNSVTGETIEVKGATAEIPSQYLQWKSNFKYTYLFKISDNTNGQTGTGTTPAGLYPITFDAVEMVNGDGKAEYITTVSEPSITTFGAIYNTSSSKYTAYQTGKDEYQAQTSPNQLDIFATFTEGSTVKTPTFGGSGEQHVNVFSVVSKDPTNFKITEASVAEAIVNPGSITNAVWTCAVTDVTAKAATELTDEGTYYKKDAQNKAPGDAGYVPTPAVKTTDYTIGATAAENTIAAGVNIYTCTVTYTSVASAAALTAGTTYYKKYGDVEPGSAGYVVTIAAEGTDYEVAPVITATAINNDNYSTYFTALPAKVTTVPGEDGVDKTIDALKLTGVKAGTYAIEYEASAVWTGTYKKVYKVIVVQ